ncbi:MAG: BTAD domain-containing putative transcriptional regulator [Clostridiales bacterium]|nr:BTAD domain-containing putative transcriptional regulator [Clostridiales bacterium]
MIELRYLGLTRIIRNGEDITHEFGGKTLALLGLLLVDETGYVTREKMISYLWPESTEDAGRYNLRYNLWLIRKMIPANEEGEEIIKSVPNGYQINNAYDFTCDVVEILRDDDYIYYPTGQLEILRKYFVGEFMEGFYFKNCDEYNEFIIRIRRRIEERKNNIYFEIIDRYKSINRYSSCKLLLDEISQSEPFDEKIAYEYMDIYSKMGQKSAALIYFSEFRNKLAENLGIGPSERLNEKYKEIKGLDGEKEHVDSKKNRSDITIEINYCPRIRCFGLSMIINHLIVKEGIHLEDYLMESDIRDLAYILPSSIDPCVHCIGGESSCAMIPDIRIAQSFFEFIKNVCAEDLNLDVTVYGETTMDEFSIDLLRYIDFTIKGFTLKVLP